MTPERTDYINEKMKGYKWFGSSSSWRIYQESNGALWLGVRTHGPAETEHDFVVRITKDEAKEINTNIRTLEYQGFINVHFVNWDLPDYPLPEVKKPSYDDITPGYWYLNSKYQEGWWIVKVEVKEGVKVITLFGDGGTCHIENYDIDQFIKKVPEPD